MGDVSDEDEDKAAITDSGFVRAQLEQVLMAALAGAGRVLPPDVLADVVDALADDGWRPAGPPRQVSTVRELSALPTDSIVLDRDGQPRVRSAVGEWCRSERVGIGPDELIELGPLTVLRTPPPRLATVLPFTPRRR